MPTPPNHAWYVPRVLKFYKNDIALCAILVLRIPFNSITSRFIPVMCGDRGHSRLQLYRIPPWDVPQCTHSSVHGHLLCFQTFCFSSVAGNLPVHVSVCQCVGISPGRGKLGLTLGGSGFFSEFILK